MSAARSAGKSTWSVSKRKPFLLLTLVLTVAVAVTAVTAWAILPAYYPDLFHRQSTSSPPCPSGATATSGQTHFAIIISNQGFNGSRTWVSCPLMSIVKGQSTTIHVVNDDWETHRVAITHYLADGVELRPGESYDVTFTADQAGSFVIYCSVECFAHNFMQNGHLNVTD